MPEHSPEESAAKVGSRLLSFGFGNAKLAKDILTFSLPSGHSCPGAKHCLAKVNPVTRKLQDGAHMKYRCFSASAEAAFPSVFKSRWANFELLRDTPTAEAKAELIRRSMPKKGFTSVRIHVGGDFYSQEYFDAWLLVARSMPGIRFYAYTKSFPFWIHRMNEIPENFLLTASRGSRSDHLILQHGLRSTTVVYSEEEAAALNLEIDHDDSHAMENGGDFALLIHGPQPTGSKAGEATKDLKQRGVQFSYSKKKKHVA